MLITLGARLHMLENTQNSNFKSKAEGCHHRERLIEENWSREIGRGELCQVHPGSDCTSSSIYWNQVPSRHK